MARLQAVHSATVGHGEGSLELTACLSLAHGESIQAHPSRTSNAFHFASECAQGLLSNQARKRMNEMIERRSQPTAYVHSSSPFRPKKLQSAGTRARLPKKYKDNVVESQYKAVFQRETSYKIQAQEHTPTRHECLASNALLHKRASQSVQVGGRERMLPCVD